MNDPKTSHGPASEPPPPGEEGLATASGPEAARPLGAANSPQGDPVYDGTPESGGPAGEAPEPSAPTDEARESGGPADEALEPSGLAGEAPESGFPREADPECPGSPNEDDAGAPEDALRAEFEHVQDQRVRLAADFDNYRKRTEERLRTRWAHAQADLLSRLLDPLDDLRRVAECDPETGTIASVLEGIDLVERKFSRILEELGVEVVDPEGEPFDPATMEAIMRVPAGAEDEDDMVERVVQRGFTLKGQLLRPARVAVYKAG